MKTKQIDLRTRFGRARVLCETLAYDDKIIFAMEPHVFRDGEKHSPFPAGVAYVMNRELANRTKGRIRHQVVEGGLFHLVRLVGHVSNGNRFETSDLLKFREEIRSCADFLLVSGVMSQTECSRVLQHLQALGAEFDAPKRAEQKLTAAKRLHDAHARRASGDRRKIAPSAMTAYAAIRHVNRRVTNVFFICRYFTLRTLAVHAILSEYYTRVEEAWRFVAPASPKRVDARGRSRVPDLGVSSLAVMLLEPGRDPKALQLLMRQTRGYATSLRSLKYQPYRSVAHLAADQFAKLGLELSHGDRDAARETLCEIRRSLRRLRMIHYFETELIARLSVYLERTPRRRRSFDAPEIVEFRMRFAKAASKIKSFNDADLELGLACEVKDRLTFAIRAFDTRTFTLEWVKAALGVVTALLAGTPQNSAPFPFPLPKEEAFAS